MGPHGFVRRGEKRSLFGRLCKNLLKNKMEKKAVLDTRGGGYSCFGLKTGICGGFVLANGERCLGGEKKGRGATSFLEGNVCRYTLGPQAGSGGTMVQPRNMRQIAAPPNSSFDLEIWLRKGK